MKRKLSAMKKIFITGIIWELLRFTFLAVSSRNITDSSFILWFTSQQLVMFYLYFFLCYNTEKYCQYLKALAAGKFLGVASGIVYAAELYFSKKAILTGFLFTVNVIVIDAVIFIVLLFAARHYFINIKTEE